MTIKVPMQSFVISYYFRKINRVLSAVGFVSWFLTYLLPDWLGRASSSLHGKDLLPSNSTKSFLPKGKWRPFSCQSMNVLATWVAFSLQLFTPRRVHRDIVAISANDLPPQCQSTAEPLISQLRKQWKSTAMKPAWSSKSDVFVIACTPKACVLKFPVKLIMSVRVIQPIAKPTGDRCCCFLERVGTECSQRRQTDGALSTDYAVTGIVLRLVAQQSRIG